MENKQPKGRSKEKIFEKQNQPPPVALASIKN